VEVDELEELEEEEEELSSELGWIGPTPTSLVPPPVQTMKVRTPLQDFQYPPTR
jgi:hypothetical protein